MKKDGFGVMKIFFCDDLKCMLVMYSTDRESKFNAPNKWSFIRLEWTFIWFE